MHVSQKTAQTRSVSSFRKGFVIPVPPESLSYPDDSLKEPKNKSHLLLYQTTSDGLFVRTLLPLKISKTGNTATKYIRKDVTVLSISWYRDGKVCSLR